MVVSARSGRATVPRELDVTEADVHRIRRDFAFTEERHSGKSLAFLDSASTSQKPRQVVDSMNRYLEKYAANLTNR